MTAAPLLTAPVAFVPSTDLDRSRGFYEGTLALEVLSTDDFALLLRSGPATIRVTAVPELTPQSFTILGWNVDDIAATVASLTERRVELVRYDGMGQDDDGVWTAPSGARVAWFQDPDGNTLSVQQPPA